MKRKVIISSLLTVAPLGAWAQDVAPAPQPNLPSQGSMSAPTLAAQPTSDSPQTKRPPHTVELKSVEVYETKPNGTKWDNALLGKQSAPDLQVKIYLGDQLIFDLPHPRKDALSAVWEGMVSAPFLIPERGDLKELHVHVIDKDLKSDDLIGKISFKPSVLDAREEKIFRLAGNRVKELRIQLHEQSEQLLIVEDLEEVEITPTVKSTTEPAPAPAVAPTPAPIVAPTATPAPDVTPAPAPVVAPTATPAPDVTPAPAPIVAPTATPAPVVTPAPAPVVAPPTTPAPVVTPAPAPVVAPTATPAPVVTPAPTPVVAPPTTSAPVVTPAPVPATAPTPAPIVTPAPTPVVAPATAPVVDSKSEQPKEATDKKEGQSSQLQTKEKKTANPSPTPLAPQEAPKAEAP